MRWDKVEGSGEPIEKKEDVKSEETQETPEEMLDEMVEEIVEGDDELVEEAQEETDTEEDTSESEEESDEEQEESEEEEEFSLEELASEGVPEAEDNVQKRIDKLTAEKYELKARLAALESKETVKSEGGERSKYTDEQLDRAEEKAIEEGDKSLLAEVRKERRKNMLADIKDELYREQKMAQEQQQQAAEEAKQVVDTFGYLKEEDSRLDITDPNSLLYKLAVVLYKNPSYMDRYQKLGGQMLCVSDAVKILRKKGLGKKKSKSEKSLEKKVKKLKKKTSVKGSRSVKEDKAKPKSKSPEELKQDYMKERMAAKERLMGLS